MATSQDVFQKLRQGGFYHIYNRGNNKETIFKAHENYFHFLRLWKKYIHPVAETFCYNLLPNHFHFFIKIRDEPLRQDLPHTQDLTRTQDLARAQDLTGFQNLLGLMDTSRQFSNLFNAYAKSINKRFKRTGSLFQERFRRKEIESEGYFTSLIGYIVTNAVKHGYCSKAEDYPYSSYSSLLSANRTLLLRDEVLDWFGGKTHFVEFIKNYEADMGVSKLFFENINDDD